MKTSLRLFFAFLISLCGLASPATALVQVTPIDTSLQAPERPSIFNEWQEQTVLRLQLEADFSSLVALKKGGDYQAASLSVHHKTKQSYTTPVKIKARGKFRRRICDFPPLKIKLQEEVIEGIEVGNYRTFKLVSHCQNDYASKEYVLKEYLAYQLYQQLTNQSFRTQLVEITYLDQGQELPKLKRYGILIEDTDELEDRLGADHCDCGFQGPTKPSQEAAARLALFQLMIGNNDWDFLAHRNIKVLQDRNDQHQIPVPYDFDFSALVSPPYAFPNPSYPVSSIYDRVMLGNDLSQESIDKAIQLFKQKEKAIFATIKNLKGLYPEDKTMIRSYIRNFYKLLDTELEWKHEKILSYPLSEE